MAQTLTFAHAPTRPAPRLTAVLAQWFRTWAKDMSDPYRPERHYMRGPGPKWHAKHGRAAPPARG